ncbi:MAG TPA: restriction endonuclease [Pseudonocardiaceae bacterium]
MLLAIGAAVPLVLLVGSWVRRNTWVLWLAAAAVAAAVGVWLLVETRLRRAAEERLRELTSGIEATDGMTGTQFEHWTAALLRRSGFTDVRVSGGAGDRGADLTAISPAGALVVVQCKRYKETTKVGSPDVQRFAGTVRSLHGADVALLVTTGGVTAPALAIAAQLGITVLTRHELAEWATYDRLPPPLG